MDMHKKKYEELMLRFAKELNDVGVTENMFQDARDTLARTPNLAAYGGQEDVEKFTYRHDGYMIEAVQVIHLSVKKCK